MADHDAATERMPYSLTVPSEVLPSGVCVCDRHGQIVYYNEGAAALWGRSPRISDAAERFCGSHRMYRLDGTLLPRAECAVAEALHRGVAVRDGKVVIERPDGSRVIAVVNVEPLKDAAGNVTGTVSWFHDISHRARPPDGELTTRQHGLEQSADLGLGDPSEADYRDGGIREHEAHVFESLRESEERFRTLADNMSQLAWMCDRLGNVTWYNKRWLDYTGLTYEEMQGWGWSKVQHPDHVDRVVARVRRSGETGEPWEDTFPLLGKDGNYRWFLSRALPIRDEQGNFVQWFGTNTDVTEQVLAEEQVARQARELRALNEQLKELDKAKTAFFSNVSHEFRTPLTLMLGPLEELKAHFGRNTSSLSVPEYQQVDLAHRNGLRLLKLVNALLDFSRIEAGRAQAVFERTDLAAYTAELAGVFRSAVETAGLRFNVECPPLTDEAFVDREMWEKIVLNLISNAFKFTHHGEIAVTLGRIGAHFELAVRDTGIGIADDQLPKVFERFHRVPGAQARTHEGAGIGLALVQELARLHGGAASVESTYGEGSTFKVTIPVGRHHLPEQQVGAPRDLGPTAPNARLFVEEALHWLPEGETADDQGDGNIDLVTPAPAGERARILLADDNADMRGYVHRLLGTRYDVEAVSDGEQALASIARNAPDVVLTDVMMPRLDGFGLLAQLRADPRTSATPVILLSVRAGEESRVEGLQAGADDYLIKPFSARELLARVEAHLKLKKLREQLQAATRESEERFRALADDAPALIWINGPEGCEFVNRGYIEFLGVSVSDVRGYDWSQFVHPDDRDGYVDAYLRAVEQRERFAAEFRFRRRDGEYRWMKSDGHPRFDAGGTFLGYAGLTVDVTERKAAEQALRAQTKRLAALNRIARTISSELDLERMVQTVTDSATELSGAQFGAFFYNVKSERGESYQLFSLSGAPREAFEKFGLPRNTAVFEPTFRGTGPVRSDDIRKDPRYGRNAPHQGMPKGHLPVVSYLAVPVVSRSGEVHGGLFFGHEQAGVFTAESEEIVMGIAAHAAIAIDNSRLYRAEKHLSAIVETSADAIVSKDLDGVITSWNKSAEHIFGYAASEVIGKPVTILIPPERHDEEPEILQRIRRGERIEHYETVRQRKDGSLIDVSLSISPVEDASGRVIGASKIARDITEKKRAEARQELLAREIHHRTKNLFAVVHAVVARSFAGKQDVKDAEAAVLGRLHSLADTHTMLMDTDWQGADLADVVRTELSPYDGRVTVEGPSLQLTARAAQNFALAVHELATNAAKHGALSNLAGQVEVAWSVNNANGQGAFAFSWQERGGPQVVPPARNGFGSAVLEQLMAEYFDPPPRIDFKAGGVTYELTGPLDVLTTDGGQTS